ncbi:aurora kinase A-interacting protein [Spea bombifrons]|uniref:aurora kinase A-interacting protein n=1 Tax=Spea bombifrons TaxID=233779 RepID=UPI00234AA0DF|nr:aurora kinase A-interacting protein [Spea bombifrons]
MWLTRLTSQFTKATRLTGCLLPRCASTNYKPLSVFYSTRQQQRQHVPSTTWYSLERELDDILVPRMMSISPMESVLASRYSLPKLEGIKSHEEPQENVEPYECPSHQDTEEVGDGREDRTAVQCKNVLKIRRRKMNKHKYKKLMKRTKFLRRKVNDGRKRRKQARFEKDLKRIWMKAGLKKAPEGWQTPKIYVKH